MQLKKEGEGRGGGERLRGRRAAASQTRTVGRRSSSSSRSAALGLCVRWCFELRFVSPLRAVRSGAASRASGTESSSPAACLRPSALRSPGQAPVRPSVDRIACLQPRWSPRGSTISAGSAPRTTSSRWISSDRRARTESSSRRSRSVSSSRYVLFFLLFFFYNNNK